MIRTMLREKPQGGLNAAHRIITIALLLCLLSVTVPAQSLSGLAEAGDPVLLNADELIYDRDIGVITARGAVELSQEGRILLADTVSYSPGQDVVTATGNVVLLEPGGETLFARHMELDGQMKAGVARNIRMLLQDKARLAAAGGRRSGGNFTEMANAVYSRCESCAEDPDGPLIWQIRAKRVAHDQARQTVEYKDAVLDMFGVPVFYTPYFSHPDPTVKRRSGFLSPTFGSSSDTGFQMRNRYYWALDPSYDLTATAIITGKAGGGVHGDYRQRFDNGTLVISGSAVRDKDQEYQSHIDATGRFDIDDHWRWGLDVERASSDDYQKIYGFGAPSLLTSRLYQEGFYGRSYARVEAFSFQSLEKGDDPGKSPLVLPEAVYNYVGDPNRHGAFFTFDGGVRALTRDEGSDSQRITARNAWVFPHIGRLGDVTRLTASVQTDVHGVQNHTRKSKEDFDGVTARIHPQLAVDWRYPVYMQRGSATHVIEPITMMAIAPAGGDTEKIPNEDSRAVELDDVNIFSHNRFGGKDRLEDGARVSYGLQWTVIGEDGGSSHVLIAQSVRALDNDTFSVSSGLSDRVSDIVGRVQVEPVGPLDLVYRFRADKDDASFVRNQLTLSTAYQSTGFSMNYFNSRRQTDGGTFPEREEIGGSVSFNAIERWGLSASATRDLTGKGRTVSTGFGARYEDECFVFSLNVGRNFTKTRRSSHTDTIYLQFSFKTLGDIKNVIKRQ